MRNMPEGKLPQPPVNLKDERRALYRECRSLGIRQAHVAEMASTTVINVSKYFSGRLQGRGLVGLRIGEAIAALLEAKRPARRRLRRPASHEEAAGAHAGAA